MIEAHLEVCNNDNLCFSLEIESQGGRGERTASDLLRRTNSGPGVRVGVRACVSKGSAAHTAEVRKNEDFMIGIVWMIEQAVVIRTWICLSEKWILVLGITMVMATDGSFYRKILDPEPFSFFLSDPPSTNVVPRSAS